MTLTNLKVQAAKPKDKKYKLYDALGLYLEVWTNGAKYWRYKYRIHNKEKLISLGVYPEITLAEARKRCLNHRELITQNIDPSTAKKDAKREARRNVENSFEVVARQWHDIFKHKWTERHAGTVLHRLEVDIFPEIGSYPISIAP